MRRIPSLFALSGLLLLIGACSGDELYQPRVDPAGDDTVQVTVPDSILLPLPDRPDESRGASELYDDLRILDLQSREGLLRQEILQGNIPDFLRSLQRLDFTRVLGEQSYEVTIFASVDYLSVGSGDDFCRMPMTPILAQELADSLGCVLPTKRLVDEIWSQSDFKFQPQPIPPSADMVTIPVFYDHNALVEDQRLGIQPPPDLGTLFAGHKKDVILSGLLSGFSNKVIIYGWHYPGGQAIQPVYAGHVIWYADYSHGIRLVSDRCWVNGSEERVTDLLQDQVFFRLVSDEATPMQNPRYSTDPGMYPR